MQDPLDRNIRIAQPAGIDGDTLTFSISGGADAALFDIDSSSGALSFLAAPDFENPTDAGADNTYEVVVTADGPKIITLFPCEELMVANEY